MKVLIVEDEPLAADRLEDLILEYEPHIEIMAKLDSVSSVVDWTSQNPMPDLAFFDIQLADGLSFRIFEQVDFKSPIVFTTAFDEYAIQAFKVNSIDYLLKPIQFDELADAIDKYVKLFDRNSFTGKPLTLDTIRQLIDSIGKEKSYKTRFVVRKGEHLGSIHIHEILYFYTEDKVTFLRTQEGKRFIMEYTLSELEEQLDSKNFFRINRQYLISHQALKDVITHSHSRLKVILNHTDDDRIIISKQKVSDFKEWLGA